MAEEPKVNTELSDDWPRNYFNYFTEIEEHFRIARGSGLFLLSPLDWALIESWKNSGVPLEAVLRGIDKAFEKWRSRKKRIQAVNSLAYCTQAVMAEAEILAGVAAARPRLQTAEPFSIEELHEFIQSNSKHLKSFNGTIFQEIALSLDLLAADLEKYRGRLEELEQNLTVLEEKMIAAARANQSESDLLAARREFEQQLRPYRSKMTVAQIAALEKQFFDRRTLEAAGLRRLSLFYLGT